MGLQIKTAFLIWAATASAGGAFVIRMPAGMAIANPLSRVTCPSEQTIISTASDASEFEAFQEQRRFSFDNPVVVDLRPTESFLLCHWRGAVGIPAEDLVSRLLELPPPFENPIALVGSVEDVEKSSKILVERGWTLAPATVCGNGNADVEALGVATATGDGASAWRPNDFLEFVLERHILADGVDDLPRTALTSAATVTIKTPVAMRQTAADAAAVATLAAAARRTCDRDMDATADLQRESPVEVRVGSPEAEQAAMAAMVPPPQPDTGLSGDLQSPRGVGAVAGAAGCMRIAVDLGCGSGRDAVFLAQRLPGWTVVGVDRHSKALDRAAGLARQASVDDRCLWLLRDLRKPGCLDGFSADIVHAHRFMSKSVLPLVRDSVLRPGGLCIWSTFADASGDGELPAAPPYRPSRMAVGDDMYRFFAEADGAAAAAAGAVASAIETADGDRPRTDTLAAAVAGAVGDGVCEEGDAGSIQASLLPPRPPRYEVLHNEFGCLVTRGVTVRALYFAARRVS
ncbi:unnamed protein product [Phaeothamnion confervicola]